MAKQKFNVQKNAFFEFIAHYPFCWKKYTKKSITNILAFFYMYLKKKYFIKEQIQYVSR